MKIHKGFRLQTDIDTVQVVCGATVRVKNKNWSGRWDRVTCKRCRAVYEKDVGKKRGYYAFKSGKCEIEKMGVIVQVVTITSWNSFSAAFKEAGNQIPMTASLWDVEISRSADRGYELKLYFLKGLAGQTEKPNAKS